MILARGARTLAIALTCAVPVASLACGSGSSGPGVKSRSYRMGFSDFPPAPDTAALRRTVQLWNARSDAAIMHIGLVDTALAPKPALATWDSVFARPLNPALP